MSESVLIIDDAAEVRDLLAVALRGAGYRVVEADSGALAMTALALVPVVFVILIAITRG